jgi:hypothetical protein
MFVLSQASKSGRSAQAPMRDPSETRSRPLHDRDAHRHGAARVRAARLEKLRA